MIIGFEVAEQDAPEYMTWVDAKKWCESLGDGWRLPTKAELSLMYERNCGFWSCFLVVYWSSCEDYEYAYARVRAVRDLEERWKGQHIER